jgi:FolB domain-containing protein
MDYETTQQTDRVILRQLPFNINIGLDAWERYKPQPVLLSLEIPYDFQKAAVTDDVSQTLDYGKIYKSLTHNLVGPSKSASELALRIRDVLQPVEFFWATIVLPKGNLRAEGGLHFAFDFQAGEKSGEIVVMQSLSIKGIRCPCIVGVNPHEREEKQIVEVNLDIKRTNFVDGDPETLHQLLFSGPEDFVPYTGVIRKVVKVSLFCASCVITIADH